ncbi:MAG: squalene synthase HpnC [Phycisphaeraceae bacterium]|nr:squalene synthase HpnC [Phycisphaeraceae bacterium]
MDYAQAADYTRRLTRTHYENFTVVSWLLPRDLKDDFRHVYAFCRWADDLGDEVGDPERSRELLGWWRRELDACYDGRPRHPVFVALRSTIERRDIPRRPFDDLIDAFVQDQEVRRYDTWDQVLDYCTRSANPVGRLVLYLCGHRDERRQRLSDATCTALQLANFWQDVRRDVLERDRIYISRDVAEEHDLDLEQMALQVRHDESRRQDGAARGGGPAPDANGAAALLPPFRATVRAVVDRTWPLFRDGRRLLPLVRRDVRMDIRLFTLGGESILRKIERRGYDTFHGRPSLGKPARLALMVRAAVPRLWPGRGVAIEGGS